jgi:hypothetical protein
VPASVCHQESNGEDREAGGSRRPLCTSGGRRSGGIPTKPDQAKTPEEAVMLFRRDLIAGVLPFTVDDVRRELNGSDLICWCKAGAPCHADVLLAVANGGGEALTS